MFRPNSGLWTEIYKKKKNQQCYLIPCGKQGTYYWSHLVTEHFKEVIISRRDVQLQNQAICLEFSLSKNIFLFCVDKPHQWLFITVFYYRCHFPVRQTFPLKLLQTHSFFIKEISLGNAVNILRQRTWLCLLINRDMYMLYIDGFKKVFIK